MALSERQVNEARELADKKLILELDEDTYLVSSITGNNSYEVQRIYDKPYDYYCKCMGWKFARGEKVCKHCLAIRMYLEHLNESKRGKKN